MTLFLSARSISGTLRASQSKSSLTLALNTLASLARCVMTRRQATTTLRCMMQSTTTLSTRRIPIVARTQNCPTICTSRRLAKFSRGPPRVLLTALPTSRASSGKTSPAFRSLRRQTTTMRTKNSLRRTSAHLSNSWHCTRRRVSRMAPMAYSASLRTRLTKKESYITCRH